ncbi:HPr kinase/phosphorylase [Ahrensia marina]|uniref:HPr kinase/phosphorylase n=1 Tax=Ahrensia marina TaxID=1514904 RepID=UPI0006B4FEFC|nr:HPr kinase/phosphatase C-terminal domain-containing protein [Ahrensia marina]
MTGLPKNIHASLIEIEAKGVLIMGPSGSGKTSLMLHLYRRCRAADLSAHIISDDQTLLEEEQGQLIGYVPPALRGKIEIRGFGIVEREQVFHSAEIVLCIQLGEEKDVVRYWDAQYEKIGDYELKKLHLSTANLDAAANAVFAALDIPLWV